MYVRNYTQTYAGYTMTGQYEVTPADPAIGEEIWCAVLSLEVGGVDILNIVDPFIVQELEYRFKSDEEMWFRDEGRRAYA